MKSAELPRITIVTPSYQQAQHLVETIESVVSQGYPNLEYIVIDGGSTDGSVEILRKYARHITYCVSERDEGQAHAIIKGFNRASGKVLAWLNSDDTYEPNALFRVGEYYLENPDIGLLYGDYNLIDSSGSTLEIKKQPSFDLGIAKYAYMTIPQQAAFWRSDVYHAVGGVNSKFQFAMDYDLFLRMAQISRFHHIPVPLANFRMHPRSKTTTLQKVRIFEEYTIRMSCCEVKPNTLLFKPVRHLFMLKLIGKCLFEGCLMEKFVNQVRRYIK